MNRPHITLVSLISVNGKIELGGIKDRSFRNDLPKIPGAAEGLWQYFMAEEEMGPWFMTTSTLITDIIFRSEMTDAQLKRSIYVVLDDHTMTEDLIKRILATGVRLIIITTNSWHEGLNIHDDNLAMMLHKPLDSFEGILTILKSSYGCENLALQAQSDINTKMLEMGYIDEIDLVIAPVLVGGVLSHGLIDGCEVVFDSQVKDVPVLKLQTCDMLEDSYVRLHYSVVK